MTTVTNTAEPERDHGRPYLSVVIPSRNDDHAGGMLGRIQVCLDSFLQQAEQCGLDSEVVVVDWNPPRDRPPLRLALKWPAAAKWCRVRVVEVPYSVHTRAPLSGRTPFLVHRARNVGIRRATGCFIVPISPDVIFSSELVRFLASRTLQPDRMYRIDRYDVPPEALSIEDLGDRLSFCEKHMLRVHGRTALSPTDSSTGGEILHVEDCGDFTLLSRQVWQWVHGIPEEREYYALHFDAVLCHIVSAAGITEEVLLDPLRVYHIEHPEGCVVERSWLTRAALKMYKPGRFPQWLVRAGRRIAAPRSTTRTTGLRCIPLAERRRLTESIRRARPPYLFNDGLWGIGDVELPETVASGPPEALEADR